jgi:hypothetical protein
MSGSGEKFGKGMGLLAHFRARKHHEAAIKQEMEHVDYPVRELKP